MIKRLLIAVAILLGFAVVAVLTLPWWWGAALRGAAAERGLTFGTYERVGYARWALRDVVLVQPGLEVELERVELPHPLSIWWRGAAAGAIEVGPWQARIKASSDADNGKALRPSWDSLLAQYDKVMAALPPVTVAAGVLTLPDDSALALASGVAGGEGVRFTGVAFREETGDLVFERASRLIELQMAGRELMAQATLAEDGNSVTLDGSWRTHAVTGGIHFPPGGWLPNKAALDTGDWLLPGAELGLTDHYAEVAGNGSLSWQDGRFLLAIVARGEPVAERELPPLQIDVRATGSRDEVVVESAQVVMPGLNAVLDEPVRFAPASAGVGVRSHFRVEADLAALPWGALAGTVKGSMEVMPQETGWPRVRGKLDVTDFGAEALALQSAELAGELDWPRWRVSSLTARDGAGSEIDVSGNGQIGETIKLTLKVDRLNVVRASLAEWLPEALQLDAVAGRGEVAGTWPELRASGRLEAEAVSWDGFRPVDLRIDLAPEGDVATSFTVLAESDQGTGQVTAEGFWRGEDLLFERLELKHEEQALLALVNPVSWNRGQTEVTDVELRGELGHWTVPIASAAALTVSGRGEAIGLEWLRDWRTDLPARLPRIESLDAELTWSPEDFAADVATEASMELPEVGIVAGRAKVQVDREGVTITQLEIGKGERDFAAVTGRLPLNWQRDAQGKFNVAADAPIELEAVLAPNPAFWRAWGELTGVTVVGPDVRVTLGGTWSRPTGAGQVKLKRLEVAERWGGVTWPVLTDLSGTLAADGEGLRLDNLVAQVDAHVIKASGTLPLTPNDWRTLRNEPLAYLRSRGEAHLELPQAELASVARLLPEYLVPTGSASLALDFGRGGSMEGSVSLRGAVTKPIGPLGVLQDINADLSFAGREIRFESVRAMMGGQRLELDGAVEWPMDAEPQLDLHLQGNNVPLVRSTGVLLRGDLDLSLRTDGEGETTVAGRVDLRDGLMLADVRSLVPGGSERQSRRPPYFRVEVEPFRDWRLAVEVSGRRFLRMRTPILNGVASVEAQLEGTLLNPRAIGGVTLDEGVVKLPFANFEVEEAYARLSRTSPFEPEIYLRGEGRRLGYDLSMELSGTASDPRLEVSSNPSLPAEDVLLFVMAGVPPSDSGTDVTTGQRSLQLGVYLGRELVGDLLGLEPNDRLTVTTGEQLSRRGKETYRFDYDLNRRWTLTGEYDEFDYYNAGVRWRWYPWSDDEANGDGEAQEEQP